MIYTLQEWLDSRKDWDKNHPIYLHELITLVEAIQKTYPTPPKTLLEESEDNHERPR